MGRTAVSLILERLDGERGSARHVLMPPSLVVRGTSGAPARKKVPR
jgi:DNA-binding LacI/PurR family transcriptional regulator